MSSEPEKSLPFPLPSQLHIAAKLLKAYLPLLDTRGHKKMKNDKTTRASGRHHRPIQPAGGAVLHPAGPLQGVLPELLLEMSGVGPGGQRPGRGLRPRPGGLRLRRPGSTRHRHRPHPGHDRAGQEIQREQGLTNLTWQIGNVLPLPFPDGGVFPGGHAVIPSIISSTPRRCSPK